ncbi:hypothetical protein JO972_07200 [Verrucomicrobiaceae bacterium 5K15]|uniref:Uncharacterized protein n=1 Tax=Oceaniferula flava TaxID=2800421 RepID=A0AAE2SD82_9BACT|nr:hypothetical protein [Oceaniferula flavus]MBK1854739.1 hypothetical protein [Oceaniferula flavus]MBM1136045.1 hypothetical protein [Oceaniferula flavus]
MSSNYAPGLCSYGFLIPYENEAIGGLLQSAWDRAEDFDGATGETRRLKSDYVSLWMNFNDGSVSTILEVGNIPGMVATVDQLLEKKEALITVVDIHDTSPEVRACPFRIQCPQTWLGSLPPTDEQLPVSLTLTAQDAQFFINEEALAADAQLADYGSHFFCPSQLEDDLPTQANAFVIGKILLAIHTENDLTEGKFWALRVRTFAGEIWVALPDDAVHGDPHGQFIVAQGVLSGTFPDCLPEPNTATEEEGGLDTALLEERVRELTGAYFQSPEANSYFYEIHPDPIALKVSKGIGLVNKSFREAAKSMPVKRVLDSPEIRNRYQQAATAAELVMAPVVIANNQILEGSSGGPALVVIGFGEDSALFTTLKDAQEILTKAHLEGPENAQEQELATLIEDEEYHFGRRRPLPAWLVGNIEAYAVDLWIPKQSIELETLMMEIVFCLAERGPNGLTFAVPAVAINQAMDEQNNAREASSTPPPLPPGTGSTPPPLPPPLPPQ